MRYIIIFLTACVTMISANTDSLKMQKSVDSGGIEASKTYHCIKPGAAVDIVYNTVRIHAGEVSDVNITLTLTDGSKSMDVVLAPDKRLRVDESFENSFHFSRSEKNKSFDINFSLFAEADGLYYIRVFVETDNGKKRAFAVPVNVGDTKSISSQKPLQKTSKGENISVSKALETIK